MSHDRPADALSQHCRNQYFANNLEMARTIDSLYSRAVKKLTHEGKIIDVSEKIRRMNNGERTLFVYDLLNDLSLLPDTVTISKSEQLSDKYREMGNNCYKQHQNYEALQYYNLALLHAPMGSTPMCHAYSNRSVILCALKRYAECLRDIETVLSMKYPENIHSRLMQRQKICLESKDKEVQEKTEKHLSKVLKQMEKRHPEYVCASSKVKVCYSTEMGRHVVADGDIEPGEILAIENPYTQYRVKTQAMFGCNHCFSYSGNLMPCPNCCIALFCSPECMEKANKEYHSIECSIGPTLIAMDFTKIELTALRVVLKARSDHKDWGSLIKTAKNVEENMGTDRCGLVKVGDAMIYDSAYYDSIHSLATNENLRTVSDLFQKSVTAATLLHLLDKTDFLSGCSEEERIFAGNLLLRHNMISPTNNHNVSQNVFDGDGLCVSSLEIGSAAYAFLSLLNHSCAPNVTRFTRIGTSTNALVALSKIKKGMQLFDNYGYHHALQPKETRQSQLKSQYKFICKCEACENNYPLFIMSQMYPSSLPANIRRMKEKLLSQTTIQSLQRGNVKLAIEKFKPLCTLVNMLEEYTPCAEVGEVQEAMKQCLFILEGIVPHGYEKSIDWTDIVMKNTV